MPELETTTNPWLDKSFNKNTILSGDLGFNIEDIVERLGIGADDPALGYLKGQDFLKLIDTPDDYGQRGQFAQTDGLGQIAWDWPYWVKMGSNIHYPKGKVGVKTTRPIADLDVNGSLASRDLTLGSVPFIKANSIFTDANDKFFWHDATKQLNVGDYDMSGLDDFEDTFSDGTIGATWTTHNTDANRTIVEAVTTLTITVAASQDARWVSAENEAPKLYKSCPSPPFEVVAKLAAYAMPTNGVDYGIFIGYHDADQSNEKFAYKFEKKRAGAGSKYIQVNRPHSQGGLESGSDQYLTMDEDAILWFKIAVDESEDVRFYVSDDFGVSWFQMQKSSSNYAWSGFFASDMKIGLFLAGNVASETVALFSGMTVEQTVSDSIIAERFKLTDSDVSNLLKMRWNEDDSVDRVLDFKVRSGNRTLDLYENFTIGDGYDVIVTALGQANTFTMNESFTIGDGNSGTLTYSAASKTLTVEDNSLVNQDLTTDASGVQFTSLNLVGGNLNISGAAALYAKIDSNSTASFIADAHDADAYTDYKEDGTTKWTAGFDFTDSLKYKICEGVPGTNTRVEIISGGSMNVFDTAAAHIQIIAQGSGTSRFIADSYTNDAYVELQEQNVLKWCAGYDHTDGSYRISQGAPGTNDRVKIANAGAVTFSTIASGVADYDKYLVSDSGEIKYRTGVELVSDISGDIKGTDVELGEVGTATYDDVQDFVNTQASRSKITGGGATNTGSGATCTVAAGTGMIRTGDTYTSPLVFFDWAENASVAMTDNSINYVYINYNSGTPVVVVNVNQANLIKQTYLLTAVIWRDGTELHIINVDPESAGGVKRIGTHDGEEHGAHRVSGLVTSNSGTQRVAVSQGVIYAGLTRIVAFTGGFDSDNGDRFKTLYTSDSGSSWTETPNVQDFPDEQYNDITSGLVNLTTNKYGVLWVYSTFDGDSLYMQYGQGNYSAAAAVLAEPPSILHPEMAGFGILIAKLVFQKGAGTFTVYFPWETTFSASLAADHGSLTGLADVGDHNWSATKTTAAWNKSIGSGGDYADWATMVAAMPDFFAHSGLITIKAGTTLSEILTLYNKHGTANVTLQTKAEKYFPTSGSTPTADSATATTLRDAALATAALGNDYFNGCWIQIVDGTGTDNFFVPITDYVDATGDVVVSSWPGTEPDNTSRYLIVGALIDAAATRGYCAQIYNNSLDVRFDGIGFTDSDDTGIYISNCGSVYFYYCGIEKADRDGMRIDWTKYTQLYRCGIVGNNTDDNSGRGGIRLVACNRVQLYECGLSDNNRRGVYPQESSFFYSADNFGDGNGTWGIYSLFSAQARIAGTECSGSSGNHSDAGTADTAADDQAASYT